MADHPRRTVAAVAASLVALLLAAPRPQVALAALGEVGAAADPTAPVVAVAALVAWAVAGWLALTVLLVLLSRLPGLLGRGVGALTRRIAPAAVRRAVEAALGLSVAVGVLAPGAALAAPVSSPPAAASADRGWDLDWPSALSAPVPVAPRTAAPPTAAPRTAAPPTSAPPTSAPIVAPSRPAPARAAPAATPTATTPAPVRAAAAPVVVRAGDSLWSIAETALRRSGAAPTDRQVAQAWPRWWAANREAVGDDPDLLVPGTVLRPPGA